MLNKEYKSIKNALFLLLHVLIIIDLIAITMAMFWDLPINMTIRILIFDLFICIILLTEWTVNFLKSESKIEYLKQKDNIIDLIASIPFDLILPVIIPEAGLLRYLRLLKLLRVVALFNRFFHGFKKFITDSKLDKILGGVLFTIIIFTLLLYIYGDTYNLLDDFYFVVVTLTTVGYGDVVPHTFNEKLITIVLVIAGVFIFSTITAGISSFLTDRLMSDDNEKLDHKLNLIYDELQTMRNENQELKKYCSDLKNKIGKLEE